MKKQLSIHDLTALSALLDGKLSPAEKSRLESRLSKETDLREMLEELRRTRIILRNSPKIRAPHNFTLTRQMAGISEKPRSGFVYPFLKLSTVLASILFVFALLGDFFVKQPLPMFPLQAKEIAPAAESVEEFAAQSEKEATTQSSEEYSVHNDIPAAYPTMTPALVFSLPVEEVGENSSDLSNAPMEPLPSTMPSMLKVEPTSEMEEAPMAAVPEESEVQARDAASGSSLEGEMDTGAEITPPEAEIMADQVVQTEEFIAESPALTPMMDYGELPETTKPQTATNIWRVLEILFGGLIVISGLSIFVYRAKHKL